MKLSASLTIPRSRDEVFAFLSDVTNMPKWVTGVVSVRLDSHEMRLGARFTCEYRPNFRSDPVVLEVVAYEPPVLIATRSSRAPFHFEGTVSLIEAEGGTTISNTIEAGADSLSSKLATLLFGPLLLRSMRKRLVRELGALERAMQA